MRQGGSSLLTTVVTSHQLAPVARARPLRRARTSLAEVAATGCLAIARRVDRQVSTVVFVPLNFSSHVIDCGRCKHWPGRITEEVVRGRALTLPDLRPLLSQTAFPRSRLLEQIKDDIEEQHPELASFLADLGLRWWPYTVRALPVTQKRLPLTFAAMNGMRTSTPARSAEGELAVDRFWASQARAVRNAVQQPTGELHEIHNLPRPGLANTEPSNENELKKTRLMQIGELAMGPVYALMSRYNRRLRQKLSLIESEIAGWTSSLGLIFAELVMLAKISDQLHKLEQSPPSNETENMGEELKQSRIRCLLKIHKLQNDSTAYDGRNVLLNLNFRSNTQWRRALDGIVDNRFRKILVRVVYGDGSPIALLVGLESTTTLTESTLRKISKKCSLDSVDVYRPLFGSSDGDVALNSLGKGGALIEHKSLLQKYGINVSSDLLLQHERVFRCAMSYLSRRNIAWNAFNRLWNSTGLPEDGSPSGSRGTDDDEVDAILEDEHDDTAELDATTGTVVRPVAGPQSNRSEGSIDDIDAHIERDPGEEIQGAFMLTLNDSSDDSFEEIEVDLAGADQDEMTALLEVSASAQLMLILMQWRIAWLAKEDGESFFRRKLIYAAAASVTKQVMTSSLEERSIDEVLISMQERLVLQYPRDFTQDSQKWLLLRRLAVGLADSWRDQGDNSWRDIPDFEMNARGNFAITQRDDVTLKKWMKHTLAECESGPAARIHLLRHIQREMGEAIE